MEDKFYSLINVFEQKSQLIGVRCFDSVMNTVLNEFHQVHSRLLLKQVVESISRPVVPSLEASVELPPRRGKRTRRCSAGKSTTERSGKGMKRNKNGKGNKGGKNRNNGKEKAGIKNDEKMNDIKEAGKDESKMQM